MDLQILDRSYDRRQLSDRRRRPTSFLSALRMKGRRSGFRRTGEGVNTYVDRVAPRTSGLALFIVVSSILDAYLTLQHLQRGGGEANPIMAWALTHGDMPFLILKLAATGLGAWLLAAHQQVELAWKGLHGMAGVYSLLLVYHLILMFYH